MADKALIVIDMTKAFASEEGSVFHPQAKEIVPNVSDLVERARNDDVPVIWTVDFHRKGKPDWELERVRGHGMEGTVDVEFLEELQPKEDEIVLKKRRYSAFYGTDLDLILRDFGINELILVGTKVNVCIRATAQDAFTRNYSVIVPRECTSTGDSTIKRVNLDDINKYMGKVTSKKKAADIIMEEG